MSPTVEKKKNKTKRGMRAGRKLKKQLQLQVYRRRLVPAGLEWNKPFCNCGSMMHARRKAELMNIEKKIPPSVPSFFNYNNKNDYVTSKVMKVTDIKLPSI